MNNSVRQLSLMPFLGNCRTVFVARDFWWHVYDRQGRTVPDQPKSFPTQQAAHNWAIDQGYKVEIVPEGQ